MLREDVIEGIANQLRETGVFQDKYALHVRPLEDDGDGGNGAPSDPDTPDDYDDPDDLDANFCPSTPEVCGHHNNAASPCPYLEEYSSIQPCDGHQRGAYQILQGHTRIEAARRAGIETIPCWSEVLNDEEAYMQLILGNQQDGMSPLETGIHALGATEKYGRNGTGVKAYAASIGKDMGNLSKYISAARVFNAIQNVCNDTNIFLDKALHLAAIHKSPPASWPALVSSLISSSWSVKECERQVTALNEIISSIPTWYPLDVPTLTNIALTDEKLAKQIQTAMKEVAQTIEWLRDHRSWSTNQSLA